MFVFGTSLAEYKPYPSWTRSSWSTMSFGLTVTGRLTFESPSLHYTLKTLTDAAQNIKNLHICSFKANLIWIYGFRTNKN